MTALRLLNAQGIAGLAASLCLALLLLIQKGESRHWKKQAGAFEQLYRAEQSALAGTVANYRAAAEQARVADRANAARVAVAQRAINERTHNDFESRIAAARTLSERLRRQDAHGAADPRARRAAVVSGLSASPGRSAQAAGEDRLPDGASTRLGSADALTATEQAIQLDELIRWVRSQAQVDPNKP